VSSPGPQGFPIPALVLQRQQRQKGSCRPGETRGGAAQAVSATRLPMRARCRRPADKLARRDPQDAGDSREAAAAPQGRRMSRAGKTALQDAGRPGKFAALESFGASAGAAGWARRASTDSADSARDGPSAPIFLTRSVGDDDSVEWNASAGPLRRRSSSGGSSARGADARAAERAPRVGRAGGRGHEQEAAPDGVLFDSVTDANGSLFKSATGANGGLFESRLEAQVAGAVRQQAASPLKLSARARPSTFRARPRSEPGAGPRNRDPGRSRAPDAHARAPQARAWLASRLGALPPPRGGPEASRGGPEKEKLTVAQLDGGGPRARSGGGGGGATVPLPRRSSSRDGREWLQGAGRRWREEGAANGSSALLSHSRAEPREDRDVSLSDSLAREARAPPPLPPPPVLTGHVLSLPPY
jgi:hypothetical protein